MREVETDCYAPDGGEMESDVRILEVSAVGALLAALEERDYRVVGPTVRDGAIVYDELSSPSDLPAGWGDEQDGGRYRLRGRGDGALFGYAVGPHSWKRFLHPPILRLFTARREAAGALEIEAEEQDPPRYALLGVRACELHAIAIQDQVLLGGPFPDPVYRARRDRLFLIAVHCGAPAGTCFCVSMGTGPRAERSFDLALTEVLEGGSHYLVAEAGSEQGADVLTALPGRPAGSAEAEAAEAVMREAARQMGRTMEAEGVRELLLRNLESPRWDDVAERCLACTNCTMVCPTCFCTSVEDVSDLTGETSERWRRWDSCFSVDFSYLHGGAVRSSTKSRYRQWLTHKLATWHDQFGSSGCVGCGRCITWCPVGIDLTEEVAAIRSHERAAAEKESQS